MCVMYLIKLDECLYYESHDCISVFMYINRVISRVRGSSVVIIVTN